MNIATIIRDQIKTIDPYALWAWGAKDMVALEDGLQFKSSGMVKWKGIVSVTLNAKDLYDIDFGRIRKFEYKSVKKISDVFAEDLVNIIETQVG